MKPELPGRDCGESVPGPAPAGKAGRGFHRGILSARRVCQVCGARPSRRVHHLDADRRDEPERVRAVCDSCHAAGHGHPKRGQPVRSLPGGGGLAADLARRLGVKLAGTSARRRHEQAPKHAAKLAHRLTSARRDITDAVRLLVAAALADEVAAPLLPPAADLERETLELALRTGRDCPRALPAWRWLRHAGKVRTREPADRILAFIAAEDGGRPSGLSVRDARRLAGVSTRRAGKVLSMLHATGLLLLSREARKGRRLSREWQLTPAGMHRARAVLDAAAPPEARTP